MKKKLLNVSSLSTDERKAIYTEGVKNLHGYHSINTCQVFWLFFPLSLYIYYHQIQNNYACVQKKNINHITIYLFFLVLIHASCMFKKKNNDVCCLVVETCVIHTLKKKKKWSIDRIRDTSSSCIFWTPKLLVSWVLSANPNYNYIYVYIYKSSILMLSCSLLFFDCLLHSITSPLR